MSRRNPDKSLWERDTDFYQDFLYILGNILTNSGIGIILNYEHMNDCSYVKI